MPMIGRRDRAPDRHRRLMSVSLVGTLVCVAVLLISVAGCAREPGVVPTATTVPTSTSAVATPTPTPSSTVAAINPLQQSLLALGQVSSFRIKELFLKTVPGVSVTFVLTRENTSEHLVGPPERMHIERMHLVSSYSDGIEEEVICVSSECWSRTGQHPWTKLYNFSSDYLWQRRRMLDATTIMEMDVLAVSGEIVVDWRKPIAEDTGADSEYVMTGQTWLQADTYLPLREILDLREVDGTLVWHSEATYYDHDVPIVIEAPVIATVTPIPTVPAVERTPIAAHREQEELPFPGVLIVPDGSGPFPAVIVLHGSDGGTASTRTIARQFAEAGYVALALCYFGCPDTPFFLQDIDLEVIMDAVDYLKKRDDVQADAIALVGYSRGAELALIVGALDPDVRAVVSFAGSPWVHHGFPVGGTAWLYQGKPLPFLLIPVEQIDGPVLLIHGEQDSLWPVGFSYRVADRLEAHGHAHELAVYPAHGHGFYGQRPDALRRAMAFLERALQ